MASDVDCKQNEVTRSKKKQHQVQTQLHKALDIF